MFADVVRVLFCSMRNFLGCDVRHLKRLLFLFVIFDRYKCVTDSDDGNGNARQQRNFERFRRILHLDPFLPKALVYLLQ